ncbi:glycosyltransferase family 2 protein [Pseudocitrobacter faecalis]|uniref:Glycosyl transferase family 2 n=1 Tax=Pseudocitrobacter faecalis TaxID=1398493 RepID=A0ABX9G461_9ENTR|nr:glycosyl transferase family 2 [Pseudocitrobacter faecalis]
MTNKITVDVALASYNGEKYISEQIESILNQSHKNIRLYISDDGSTDNTVTIIKRYIEQDHRVHLVNTERVGGVINNFEVALKATSADYIMLSDQDDYWEYDKIEQQLSAMLIEESNYKAKPILGYTDLELVDEKLKPISNSFYASAKLNPLRNLNYCNLSWMGSVMGCTIIMNRLALDNALPFNKQIIMHDHWLAMKTLEVGHLFYIDKAFIQYRQHSRNVSGGLGFRKKLINKILDVNRYKNMVKRTKIVSSMHGLDSFYKRLKFSKNILLGFKHCETIKYPVLFLFFFITMGGK